MLEHNALGMRTMNTLSLSVPRSSILNGVNFRIMIMIAPRKVNIDIMPTYHINNLKVIGSVYVLES